MYAYLIFFYIMWGIECLLLIPFIVNLKILGKGGKWIYYYLISSFIFATGSNIIGHIWKNNMSFFSIMYFLQFIILSAFFWSIIKNIYIKYGIVVLLILVFFIFLLDLLKLEGWYAYNSIFSATRTFILITYGIIYFIQLIFDDELVQRSIFINSLPDFWYNSGLFIYHCGFFLFSLTYNFFTQIRDAAEVTLAITYIAGIIQLTLFYIGLRKAKKLRP